MESIAGVWEWKSKRKHEESKRSEKDDVFCDLMGMKVFNEKSSGLETQKHIGRGSLDQGGLLRICS